MTADMGPGGYFGGKPKARQAVWERLHQASVIPKAEGLETSPPAFAGAETAARRLLGQSRLTNLRRITVEAAPAQEAVRRQALELGIEVFVPTPRLESGFFYLCPARIPASRIDEAVQARAPSDIVESVAADALPAIDLIVVGSIAVTRRGHHAGTGRGDSDLEYAILRELGHPAIPVATTIHDLQIVDLFPSYEDDLPLSIIATPTMVIEVEIPPMAPSGIRWERLSRAQIERSALLRALHEHRRRPKNNRRP